MALKAVRIKKQKIEKEPNYELTDEQQAILGKLFFIDPHNTFEEIVTAALLSLQEKIDNDTEMTLEQWKDARNKGYIEDVFYIVKGYKK